MVSTTVLTVLAGATPALTAATVEEPGWPTNVQLMSTYPPYNQDWGEACMPAKSWGIQGMGFKGNYIYWISPWSDTMNILNRLEVVDVSDPYHPACAGILGEGYHSVFSLGNYLYAVRAVPEGIFRLVTFDLSDPAHPVAVDTAMMGDLGGILPKERVNPQLVLVGGRTASSGGGAGVAILDLSDPAHPRYRGHMSLIGVPLDPMAWLKATHVELYKDRYATVTWNCLNQWPYSDTSIHAIYDLADPANPKLLSWMIMRGGADVVYDHFIVGDTWYVSEYGYDYSKYLISDPANPVGLPGRVLPRGFNISILDNLLTNGLLFTTGLVRTLQVFDLFSYDTSMRMGYSGPPRSSPSEVHHWTPYFYVTYTSYFQIFRYYGPTAVGERPIVTVPPHPRFRLTGSVTNDVFRLSTVAREDVEVSLTLYDAVGRRVARLYEGAALPEQTFSLSRLGAKRGVYFLRCTSGAYARTLKVVYR